MAAELLANKKAYNTRKKELLDAGYRKCREYRNTESFIKHHEEIKLVQGWKKTN